MKLLIGIILGVLGTYVAFFVYWFGAMDGWFDETPAQARKREEKRVEKFWVGWDKIVAEKGLPWKE